MNNYIHYKVWGEITVNVSKNEPLLLLIFSVFCYFIDIYIIHPTRN